MAIRNTESNMKKPFGMQIMLKQHLWGLSLDRSKIAKNNDVCSSVLILLHSRVSLMFLNHFE